MNCESNKNSILHQCYKSLRTQYQKSMINPDEGNLKMRQNLSL